MQSLSLLRAEVNRLQNKVGIMSFARLKMPSEPVTLSISAAQSQYLSSQDEDLNPCSRQNIFRVLKKGGGIIWAWMQGSTGRFEGKPANLGSFFNISAVLFMKTSRYADWLPEH